MFWNRIVKKERITMVWESYRQNNGITKVWKRCHRVWESYVKKIKHKGLAIVSSKKKNYKGLGIVLSKTKQLLGFGNRTVKKPMNYKDLAVVSSKRKTMNYKGSGTGSSKKTKYYKGLGVVT